jgi:hypothetical protein
VSSSSLQAASKASLIAAIVSGSKTPDCMNGLIGMAPTPQQSMPKVGNGQGGFVKQKMVALYRARHAYRISKASASRHRAPCVIPSRPLPLPRPGAGRTRQRLFLPLDEAGDATAGCVAPIAVPVETQLCLFRGANKLLWRKTGRPWSAKRASSAGKGLPRRGSPQPRTARRPRALAPPKPSPRPAARKGQGGQTRRRIERRRHVTLRGTGPGLT